MSEAESVQDISYLRKFGQVASEYRHRPKVARPGEALVTPAVYLKWYDIYYEETPISPQLVDQARSFLLAELEAGRLALKNEIGFAVHHRCSAAYILYICTWRNENELWETIYIKDLVVDSEIQQLKRNATTPTYCVWVLGAVGHEQQAWTRYLYSSRDDAAKYAYVRDQITGPT
jgi:hypothetical protein